MHPHVVLELGWALLLMALVGVLALKLRFPIIPLLILAGLAAGPYAPHWGPVDFRFLESAQFIHTLGRLGVLFLLMYLGLEFSVNRLLRAGRAIFKTGSIYMAVNLAWSLALGWLAGWPLAEVLALAGILTISSSAITAKLLVDLKRTANPETEIILGINLYQDVFVAVYLVLLSGLILGSGSSPMAWLTTIGGAVLFLLALLWVGRKLTPLLNRVLNIPSDEVFLLAVLTLLALVAGFSERVHVAEAIGALLIGMVLAETEHRQRIEHLLLPFRDLFGAIFFFSFGLSIDYRTLGGATGLTLVAIVLTLAGCFAAGLLAARSARLSPRAGVNIGATISSRGEFSIIVANLAAAGSLLPVLQPFTALYVLIMAALGPVLTKESRAIYQLLVRLRLLKGRPQAAPAPQPPGPRPG